MRCLYCLPLEPYLFEHLTNVVDAFLFNMPIDDIYVPQLNSNKFDCLLELEFHWQSVNYHS